MATVEHRRADETFAVQTARYRVTVKGTIFSVQEQSPEDVTVSADDPSGFRDTELFVFGATLPPTSYPLIPAFTTTTFNGATMSWTTLPTATFTSLAAQITSSDDTQFQNLTVSQAWIAARQATSLTFDASAPGFESAWNIDPSGAGLDLEITDNNSLTGFFSTATSLPGDALAPVRHRRAIPRKHTRR